MMSVGREKRSGRGGESQVSQGSSLRGAVVAKMGMIPLKISQESRLESIDLQVKWSCRRL